MRCYVLQRAALLLMGTTTIRTQICNISSLFDIDNALFSAFFSYNAVLRPLEATLLLSKLGHL